jgi:predicted nucleic acid-binding protein
MIDKSQVLVFDTGPLSHFAKQSWLGALRLVTAGRTAIVPDTVVDELRAGVREYPHLQMVLDATWLEQRPLISSAELEQFARFASVLVANDRNLGECGVLAYAKVNDATAVIDDGPARKIAREYNVPHIGTLGLLCEALQDGILTVELISAVADDLIEGEYRLPFLTGGFRKWALDNGLVPSPSPSND